MVAMDDRLNQAIQLQTAAMAAVAAAHVVLVVPNWEPTSMSADAWFWPYRCDRRRCPDMEAVGRVNYAGYHRSADWRHLDYGRQDGCQSWARSMNDMESALGEKTSAEIASENIPFGEAAFGGTTFAATIVLATFVTVIVVVTEACGTLWQTSREPLDLLLSAFPLPSSPAVLLHQVARPS
jgi:hypothetical protein